MSARWWAFIVWAVVAASAVYWGLQLVVAGRPAPPGAVVAAVAAAPRGDVTRVLGADPPPPVVVAEATAPESSRFQLVGTVAGRGGGPGLAVIVVDGKTPRTFRVGSEVDGSTVLQSVGLRSAALGPRGGSATVALDIPPPAAPSTGVLPGPVNAPAMAAPPPQLPQQMAPPPQLPPNAAPVGVPRPAVRPGTALQRTPTATAQQSNDGAQRNQPDVATSQ